MKGLVSGQMKRAIVRARKQLRGSTTRQLQDYGLNRYRVARKIAPIVILVKSRKSTEAEKSDS
jgi:hypothetical protein